MKKGQSFSLLSQGNPNSITRGGQPPADESGVKKAQQPSLKKSADNSSLSSSSPPMASPHLEEKTKKQQQQKKKKSTKVLDPTTIKYVPPPPSAPPEWAVELPKPMEENRFVLDVSKKEKQALKRLEINNKKKSGVQKALSSHDVKSLYISAPGVSPPSARIYSPRLLTTEIRISAPRNFRNLRKEGLFGVPLESVMKGYPEWQVPPFLEQLCMHIEYSCLTTEGIFRMPGSIDETKKIRDSVNNGVQVDLWQVSSTYVLCDLLKIYYREYPDGIIPLSMQPAFIELASQSPAAVLQDMRALFKEVPSYNKFVLKRTLQCLSRVIENAPVNKMDATNLATVFGPSFFSTGPMAGDSKDQASVEKKMAEAKHINTLAVTLLKNHDAILKDVEYKPYYKCYAKVIKAYNPRTEKDLELVEGDIVIITGNLKGTLFMGETSEDAGLFPMANVSVLGNSPLTNSSEEQISFRAKKKNKQQAQARRKSSTGVTENPEDQKEDRRGNTKEDGVEESKTSEDQKEEESTSRDKSQKKARKKKEDEEGEKEEKEEKKAPEPEAQEPKKTKKTKMKSSIRRLAQHFED